MKLIVNSGSTKTYWYLIENNKVKMHFGTEAYDLYNVNRQYIINSIYMSFPESFIYKEIKAVNFYKAAWSINKISIIEDVLKVIFKNASILVEIGWLLQDRCNYDKLN